MGRLTPTWWRFLNIFDWRPSPVDDQSIGRLRSVHVVETLLIERQFFVGLKCVIFVSCLVW